MARIVVIDDQPDILRLVTQVLTRRGHEVAQFGDAASAIEAVRSRGADLVLTDVFMPNMDGIELMTQLSAEAPDVPVIAMSGGSIGGPSHVLTDAEFLGAAATLPKPFSLRQLTDLVDEVLSRGSTDENRRPGAG